MKNWKTSLAGGICVIAAVALMYVGKAVEGGTLIVVGLGLIAAKDNNVSGGTVAQ